MRAFTTFALRHQVLSYFVLAYSITYAIDAAAITTAGALFLFGTFGPLVSAVVLTRLESGWAGKLLNRLKESRFAPFSRNELRIAP